MGFLSAPAEAGPHNCSVSLVEVCAGVEAFVVRARSLSGSAQAVDAEVAMSRGVTKEEVLARPELYGMAGPMMDRYNNGLKTRDALAQTAERTGAPTFLQVYEPEAFKGDGRAAIAIGDPDHADNTAVVVPGTGNSVGSGWMGGDDAVNLYNEAKAADRSQTTAVVAWMGYDAPDSPIDPRIGATDLAREGGQLLAADVNALNVTREGAGHMTVLGHSYGSTTVADAAAGYGMRTDDVVLVGSPGTDMAQSAADFHLNEGDVLLEFYRYPAEQLDPFEDHQPDRNHIRHSAFANQVTKGPGSRAAGLAMADKLIEAAQGRWRSVNAPHLVALVRAGAIFHNGKLLERPRDIAPTESESSSVTNVA